MIRFLPAFLVLACLARWISSAQTFRPPPYFAAAGPAPRMQRTVPVLLDLDEDGRIDLRLAREVRLQDGKFRLFVEPSPGGWLVGGFQRTTTNGVFGYTATEPREAHPGLVVDPAVPRPAGTAREPWLNWFRIHDETSGDGGNTLWGTTNQTLHLGLVFRALDGLHAAWIRLERRNSTNWILAASAWEPQPGLPLAVGGSPTPGPPAPITFESRYSTLVSETSSADRDLTLGRRRWTNHVDHSHGLLVDVRGHDEWSWWTAADGNTNGPGNVPLLQAWPAPERIDIPVNAPLPWPGVSARTSWSGIILYAEHVEPDGRVRQQGQGLADGAAYAVFTHPEATGWVRLQRNGDDWTFTGARAAFATGAPEVPYARSNPTLLQKLDLNSDGRLDFLTYREDYSDPASGFFANYLHLVPLPGAAIRRQKDSVYLGPQATGQISPGDTWQSYSELYYGRWASGFLFFGELGPFQTNGWMGVRFPAADGLHYGWLHLGRTEASPFVPVVDESAFNAWPDEGLRVGAPPPAPLRIDLPNLGRTAIRWPASVAGTLERQSPPSIGPWLPLNPATPGRHEEEPDGVGALFRLR